MHVLFPQMLHHPLTSCCLTIEPQDSQDTKFIQSRLQPLNEAGRTQLLIIEHGQTLVAAKFSTFHTLAAQVLQSYGVPAISADKPKIHSITNNCILPQSGRAILLMDEKEWVADNAKSKIWQPLPLGRRYTFLEKSRFVSTQRLRKLSFQNLCFILQHFPLV